MEVFCSSCPKSVLIVDDESDIRDLLGSLLKPHATDLYFAENGLEAIKILKNKEINVAIIDFKMPKMDGLELLKYIKEKHRFVNSVMVTAYAEKEDIIKAIEIGVFDFIEKPFNEEILVNRVKQAIIRSINFKLFHQAIMEFITMYCNVKEPEKIPNLPIEDQNKLIEQAMKILIIKNIQREIKL